MNKAGIPITVSLAVTVLLATLLSAQAATLRVPNFDLPALDGRHYSEQYLLGRPALLVFWASWCPVCQVELPKLHALFEDVKDKGLHVLTVGFADDEERIRNYVQTHPAIFDYPVLYDSGDLVAKRFGVFGTPTIFLVNRRGEIEYVTWLIDDPALMEKLKRLLNSPAARERRSRTMDNTEHAAAISS